MIWQCGSRAVFNCYHLRWMEVQLTELNLCPHLGPPGAPVYQVGLQFVGCPSLRFIWPGGKSRYHLGSSDVQSLQDAITDSRLLGWGILQQMGTWEFGKVCPKLWNSIWAKTFLRGNSQIIQLNLGRCNFRRASHWHSELSDFSVALFNLPSHFIQSWTMWTTWAQWW